MHAQLAGPFTSSQDRNTILSLGPAYFYGNMPCNESVQSESNAGVACILIKFPYFSFFKSSSENFSLKICKISIKKIASTLPQSTFFRKMHYFEAFINKAECIISYRVTFRKGINIFQSYSMFFIHLTARTFT